MSKEQSAKDNLNTFAKDMLLQLLPDKLGKFDMMDVDIEGLVAQEAEGFFDFATSLIGKTGQHITPIPEEYFAGGKVSRFINCIAIQHYVTIVLFKLYMDKWHE